MTNFPPVSSFASSRRVFLIATAALFLGSLAPVSGGELKVDINRDSKNLDSVTEVGFVKWSQDASGGAAAGTAAVSKSFTTTTGENVTVTFAQTAASQAAGGTGLLSNWYQTGAQGSAQVVSDGLTVSPANLANGGQIQMTVTGLAAGSHTLLTYHNAWDALAAGSIGPIDISVNGSLAVDNLIPTIRAATNFDAAYAYLSFTVSGPADVTTILFAAEPTGGAYSVRNALINGFEIDTPNIFRIASNPYPADGDGHVDADSGSVTLSWAAARDGNTISHDVYFGTDFTTVKNASHGSPAFLGNQGGTTRTVTVNDPYATYYWRIDQINSSSEVTAGTVWNFRPRHLAFPGAEGYGRFARGGRGGRVVHVTSLQDYATGETPIPGTLRYAIKQETGPRVIVFNVGGLITLKERLTLSDPFVTVAGQTAPGKGICLRQFALGLSGAKDAVIRFIRNRPGNISGQTIDGGGLAGCDHSIMDHCSISWSIDEAFSGRSAKNITLQRTLISEALNVAGHQNYPAGTKHGYAATISGDIGSYHHNLLAHCEGRNWSLGGGLDAAGFFAGRMDLRNNVVYNWGSRTTDGGAHEVNFVSNYYKPGAATKKFTALNPTYDNFPGTQQYYMVGNVMPGYFDESNQAAGRTVEGSNGGSVPTTYPVWVTTPFFDHHVDTQTALAAYKRVLSDVGANRPLDDHDTRIIQETRTGTYTYTAQDPYGGAKGLPNSQADVGGWEDYPVETRKSDWDSDKDGLPNWWEEIHGTNVNSPANDFSDANADPENDGYTRLDDYLAWMAKPRLWTTPDVSVDLDIAPLTVGYTAGPVYGVSGAVNGTVQLLPDGHTARFNPSFGFTGLGEFSFSVTDTAGHTMTGKVGVRIMPKPNIDPQFSITGTATPMLQFMGVPGVAYHFKHSSNLTSWTPWQTITAGESIRTIPVPASLLSSPRYFFRAEQ